MASRFQYVPALQKMGAKITYFQPEVNDPEAIYNFDVDETTLQNEHAIRIQGPTTLTGGNFAVVDLRHGATLVVAALAAQGTTTLTNISQIDRGYESLEDRLKSMGANIMRKES